MYYNFGPGGQLANKEGELIDWGPVWITLRDSDGVIRHIAAEKVVSVKEAPLRG